MRNRLALNDLMREFCAEEGITFLDLTAELQSKLRPVRTCTSRTTPTGMRPGTKPPPLRSPGC